MTSDTPQDIAAPSAEAMEAAQRCRDAWFLLTISGDAQRATLYHGWEALHQAIYDAHYYDIDSEQMKEVDARFLDWEDWDNALDGFPWRWSVNYEDGAIAVERILDTTAIDSFVAQAVDREVMRRRDAERKLSDLLGRLQFPDENFVVAVAKQMQPIGSYFGTVVRAVHKTMQAIFDVLSDDPPAPPVGGFHDD